jgi:hypothetical protein
LPENLYFWEGGEGEFGFFWDFWSKTQNPKKCWDFFPNPRDKNFKKTMSQNPYEVENNVHLRRTLLQKIRGNGKRAPHFPYGNDSIESVPEFPRTPGIIHFTSTDPMRFVKVTRYFSPLSPGFSKMSKNDLIT